MGFLSFLTKRSSDKAKGKQPPPVVAPPAPAQSKLAAETCSFKATLAHTLPRSIARGHQWLLHQASRPSRPLQDQPHSNLPACYSCRRVSSTRASSAFAQGGGNRRTTKNCAEREPPAHGMGQRRVPVAKESVARGTSSFFSASDSAYHS